MSDAEGKVYKEYYVDFNNVDDEEIRALRWLVDTADREIFGRFPDGEYVRNWEVCKEIVRKLEGALDQIKKDNSGS